MRISRLIAGISGTMALIMAFCATGLAQETVIVRPREIDDVLTNPGIGFMTFQRFNGDTLNEAKGWTEGKPIVYQDFDGDLKNEDYPDTTIAYFRIYWKFIEPEMGEYRYDLIDKALDTARQRGQTLMLRIAPYGTGNQNDVPGWYRTLVGDKKDWREKKWQVDPEDPRYVKHFTAMIHSLGERYDGHTDLESVDVSIVGAWGEGASSALLTPKTRHALVDAYIDSFKKTHLVMLLTDEKTNGYALSRADVGWRVDCLGDMGGFSPTWSHMNDYYPQAIINFGTQDAWKKAPVTLEVCWVMQHWKDMGWDVDHIIAESLKWHISSFNAKSSPVPEEWWPSVNSWLRAMGYRFILRKFTYPSTLKAGEKLSFTSWWENAGVAPCYRKFPLALRLKSDDKTEILTTDADITTWLPGDNLYDNAVAIPANMPADEYDLQIGILDLNLEKPKVKLAISGRDTEGWYPLGKITIAENRLGEMVTIGAGSFLMGNNGHEGFGVPEEFPQHSVNLPTYQIGKYEVTRGQYRKFIEAGGYKDPSYWSPEGWKWKQSDAIVYAGMYGKFNRLVRPDADKERSEPEHWAAKQEWIGHGYAHPIFIQTYEHPVVGVTYYEAEAYCKWACGRLPTEAEWEKAARWDEKNEHANTWPWGDTWDTEKCNNPEDHNPAGGGYKTNQSAPVGSYPDGAGPYGCMDMVGNAYEWVADQAKSYPGNPKPFDHNGFHFVRGGCWDDGPLNVRCAYRGWYLPPSSGGVGPGDSDYIGFRIAR